MRPFGSRTGARRSALITAQQYVVFRGTPDPLIHSNVPRLPVAALHATIGLGMPSLSLQITDTLASIQPSSWDALVGEQPLLSHAFLHALHENELPFINGGKHVAVPEIPTLASLGVIIVTLVITTVASLYKTRVKDKKDPEISQDVTDETDAEDAKQ